MGGNQTAIFQPLNSCCYPLILYNCDGTLLTRQKEQSSIPKLYPNPTQNILSFESIQGSWQITDLQGKIITSGFSDGKKENISVSDLSTGIYLFIHEHFKTKFVKE